MIALTLTQPWASLVALGEKRIETRSWTTNYRGPLLIHAAKGFPADARDTCYEEPFWSVLLRHGLAPGLDALPRGVIVASCELAAVEYIANQRLSTALDPSSLSEQERDFGNYAPGRWAWRLEKVRPIVSATVVRGSLGLWECAA